MAYRVFNGNNNMEMEVSTNVPTSPSNQVPQVIVKATIERSCKEKSCRTKLGIDKENEFQKKS